MHCPWCGFQNSSSGSFCRSCGEDLKKISDILEGHVPVGFAAKKLAKDAEDRIGRRVEYYRLYFVSALIMAAASLALILHGWGSHFQRISFGTFAVFWLLMSIPSRFR
ncbi:MAG TPA: hypothetical protein VI756_25000 [Blastocatellia bacterium]